MIKDINIKDKKCKFPSMLKSTLEEVEE